MFSDRLMFGDKHIYLTLHLRLVDNKFANRGLAYTLLMCQAFFNKGNLVNSHDAQFSI